MTLNQLRDLAYQNAKNKGFHDKETPIATRLMLIVTEVAEACEADRKGNYSPDEAASYVNTLENDEDFRAHFGLAIKNTFADELADIVIRVGDLCGAMKIDLEAHVAAKTRYNQMREHKHGKFY